MTLPTLAVPKFSIKLPSSNEDVFFRPFLVKEEKALLLAGESQDPALFIKAIKDTITACVEDVDASKLPYFDVEFLFLNLRAKSAGEEIKYTYRHRGEVNRLGEPCAAATEVVINIDDIKIQWNPEHKSKFMLDDKYGVIMRHPSIDDVIKLAGKSFSETEAVARCIEAVYDNDTVFPSDNLAETLKFVENLNSAQYEKLSKWFDTMPVLKHTFSYKCAGCGQEDTITYEGVSDFF